jgi:hypothetical protein
MQLNRFTAPLQDLSTVSIFDDFTGDQVDTSAVDTITDTGTVLMGDDVNGVATLTPSDGTVVDNDEAYLATPNEIYKFGTNRNIYGRWKFRYTAVVAADPNIAVGFQNAVGANSIVDNGGVKTSGSTLAIEKKDGETAFRCTSACNGTAVTTLSNKTIAAATDYVAEIECLDWDGVSMKVVFKIDGEYLKDTNNNVIKHTVAIASATEMQMFAGIKLGANTNNDTLLLDYWYGAQTRV